MKKLHNIWVALFMTTLLIIMMAGCGGNSGGETEPAPPQTGDLTLFPNKTLLASAANINISQTIVLDARSTESEYNSGHIPGALFVPPTLFESDGNLLPDVEIAEILGSKGIARESKIIIYDNTSASLGAGGRLFWILEYFGCTDVTILNGGWSQWRAQDNPIETTTVLEQKFTPTTFTPEVNTAVVAVTKEYVVEHFFTNPKDGFILLDVRTDEEYNGFDKAGNLLTDDPRPGHIVGAINFPYKECFNSDGTVLNFADLKKLLETHGVTLDEDKLIVAYSTFGHRSGFFYFLCRLMGYTNVANYIGSINDWGKAGLTEPDKYPMETIP